MVCLILQVDFHISHRMVLCISALYEDMGKCSNLKTKYLDILFPKYKYLKLSGRSDDQLVDHPASVRFINKLIQAILPQEIFTVQRWLSIIFKLYLYYCILERNIDSNIVNILTFYINMLYQPHTALPGAISTSELESIETLASVFSSFSLTRTAHFPLHLY